MASTRCKRAPPARPRSQGRRTSMKPSTEPDTTERPSGEKAAHSALQPDPKRTCAAARRRPACGQEQGSGLVPPARRLGKPNGAPPRAIVRARAASLAPRQAQRRPFSALPTAPPLSARPRRHPQTRVQPRLVAAHASTPRKLPPGAAPWELGSSTRRKTKRPTPKGGQARGGEGWGSPRARRQRGEESVEEMGQTRGLWAHQAGEAAACAVLGVGLGQAGGTRRAPKEVVPAGHERRERERARERERESERESERERE